MKFPKLPLIVKILIAIALGVGFGLIAPGWAVRAMNTFDGIFDQLLRFFIPLIIIGLVTPAIAEVGAKAGKMLVITVVLAYTFTVLSGLFAYSFSMSFMLGIGIASSRAGALRKGFEELKAIIVRSIEKIIIPVLPFYIFGLFLDMTAAGQVAPVLKSFLVMIGVIFGMTILLLVLQYCIAGAVAGKNPFKALAGMLPAYMTALGTASSAATIPVTLECAKKNGVKEEVAGFVVPLCATIHLSGSTLKITSCAIALMIMLGIPFDFGTMLGFIMMLGVTMVAAPGVPGGAIMAALGVLGSILGFDAQAQAMMITLYIAMDSFGTACNVTGDGAIALIMNRIIK